jgi:hypothetical protein
VVSHAMDLGVVESTSYNYHARYVLGFAPTMPAVVDFMPFLCFSAQLAQICVGSPITRGFVTYWDAPVKYELFSADGPRDLRICIDFCDY